MNVAAAIVPRSEEAPAGPAKITEPVVAQPEAAEAIPLDVVDDVPPRREPPAKPSPSPSVSPAIQDGLLRVGSRGPEVQALEQRLADLKYMVGKVDGVFDNNTRHGLIAFQKVEGLSRSGIGDGATMGRLPTATTPAPKYSAPANHLEVDIPKQTVYVVRGGAVTAILPTSTGSNKNFTNGGWTRRAITPNGRFTVSRKINGMRISPLGELYKPSYFNGGIAFHGNGSVPTYPASHGCVRLPMGFADWFFNEAAPIGQVVFVHGGPTGPNPQPTIEDAPAPAGMIPTEPVIPPDPAAPPPPAPAPVPPANPPAPPVQPPPPPTPEEPPSPLPTEGNKALEMLNRP
ncbi:MAG TPA: L,D-transpeptidase family protein [Actinomycetota bacterium]|nr:L,D-transpeptidase family protein [Actinomycetota bacterium]